MLCVFLCLRPYNCHLVIAEFLIVLTFKEIKNVVNIVTLKNRTSQYLFDQD